MSQHDMDIANQTFPNFRTDLNSALVALVGISSGASAPSTTFAYMLWADTTNGVLKERDSANAAWIILGSLKGAQTLSKSANYTVALEDFEALVLCDGSGGAFTITLPAVASAVNSFPLVVKKTDSSTNAITIDGNASETIDGALTQTLTAQYDSLRLVANGSSWSRVANFSPQAVRLDTAQKFTKPQAPQDANTTGTGGTLTIDPSANTDHNFTLSTAPTLANPTIASAQVGLRGSIRFINTNGLAFAVGSYWKRVGSSSAPTTLPTGATTIARIDYHIVSTSRIEYVYNETVEA